MSTNTEIKNNIETDVIEIAQGLGWIAIENEIIKMFDGIFHYCALVCEYRISKKNGGTNVVLSYRFYIRFDIAGETRTFRPETLDPEILENPNLYDEALGFLLVADQRRMLVETAIKEASCLVEELRSLGQELRPGFIII